MPKILVVDDDEDIVNFLVMALRSVNYEVDSAFGGVKGIAKALEMKPDLVILDLMMPDMHGFEVCERLRADPSLNGTKIMISSAKGYDVDKRAAAKMGADSYLTKPYTADMLLKSVGDLVGKT